VADARLLRAVAPVIDIVPRAERREWPDMMHVNFAGVARHGLGHAEKIGATGAEKGIPQQHVWHELGVDPGPAADVVAPLVATDVVVVHDSAEILEAVP